MSIRQLPKDLVDKIQSSATVTSLNGVVAGLFKNALDAGADKIHITVDYARGDCTVEDNGVGIPPGEFLEHGGLGKAYHTSKMPLSPEMHGRHGNFLASVASLALLFVVSGRAQDLMQSSLSVRHGQVLARHSPCLPQQRLEAFEHGTRVSVRDLFGSMPVRVKHRSIVTAERSRLDREWNKLLREAVALLLPWPSEVAVLLWDSTTQRELRLRSAELVPTVPRTARLFHQAGYTDDCVEGVWTPISATSQGVTIQGCISLAPSATKHHQFLSLGVQAVGNEHGSNVLYDEINQAFSDSSFGMAEEDGSGRAAPPRKGIERWPMFHLQIHTPDIKSLILAENVSDDRGSHFPTIVHLVKAVCRGFLKKHSHQPRNTRSSAPSSLFSTERKSAANPRARPFAQPSEAHSPPPQTQGGLRHASPFDGWQRVKIGPAAPTSADKDEGVTSDHFASRTSRISRTNRTPSVDEEGRLPGTPGEDEADDTGVASGESTSASLSPSQRSLVSASRNSESHVGRDLVPESSEGCLKYRVSEAGGSLSFGSGAPAQGGSIDRGALRQAEVISQVDRKYILVKLPLLDRSSREARPVSGLVMLDQHACDERVKLEDLMKSYFREDKETGLLVPETESLVSPLLLEISNTEAQTLDASRPHFVSWGVMYDVWPATSPGRSARILVRALPPSIAERCRTETKLLFDLLRKESWKLYERGLPPAEERRAHSTSPRPWVSHFHACPQGILHLLHSRSCRSAVMFNDVLSREECQRLVVRLTECAFPFQCAHGRPSMVPIVDAGSGPKMGGWNEFRDAGSGTTEADKWKRWMGA